MNNVRVADIGQQLREDDVDADPVRQFADWFTEEVYAGVRAPEAVVLATASADGSPSARMVLVKRFDDAGFVFFTNYDSRKGVELEANPRAALLFHWDRLGPSGADRGHGRRDIERRRRRPTTSAAGRRAAS